MSHSFPLLHRRHVLGLGAAAVGLRALAAGAPAAGTPPALPPCDPPPAASLDYAVTGEVKGFGYRAQGRLDWRREGDRYDARMALSMPLLGERVQTSQGRIGAEGLRPERFADRRRSTERVVNFDRAGQRIRFDRNAQPAELQPGAQDRLSLFLQLAGVLRARPRPSGEAIEFQVAGSGDAEVWRFEVGPLQPLALPAGNTQGLWVARSPRKPNDSRVEIWLAPDLGYLPVRLRITQPDGDMADQQLTRWP